MARRCTARRLTRTPRPAAGALSAAAAQCHRCLSAQVRIYRRGGKRLSKEFAERLFKTINADEALLTRLTENCSYLKVRMQQHAGSRRQGTV